MLVILSLIFQILVEHATLGAELAWLVRIAVQCVSNPLGALKENTGLFGLCVNMPHRYNGPAIGPTIAELNKASVRMPDSAKKPIPSSARSSATCAPQAAEREACDPTIPPLSELLKEMGGDVSEERKREMKALFDGQAALKEHFGIPAE